MALANVAWIIAGSGTARAGAIGGDAAGIRRQIVPVRVTENRESQPDSRVPLPGQAADQRGRQVKRLDGDVAAAAQGGLRGPAGY
jgi:hypothetical protein